MHFSVFTRQLTIVSHYKVVWVYRKVCLFRKITAIALFSQYYSLLSSNSLINSNIVFTIVVILRLSVGVCMCIIFELPSLVHLKHFEWWLHDTKLMLTFKAEGMHQSSRDTLPSHKTRRTFSSACMCWERKNKTTYSCKKSCAENSVPLFATLHFGIDQTNKEYDTIP